MWYIYTVGNYTAVQNEEFTGKQMELEKKIMSDVTQTSKDKYVCYVDLIF